MFSRSSIYPLPRDGALSAHINDDYNHISRYKSYQKYKLGWIGEKFSFGDMPNPNMLGLAVVLNKTFPSPTAE